MRDSTGISSRNDDEGGQAVVEYGLILVLVSLVAIGTLSVIGTDIQAVLPQIATAIEAAL